MATHSSVLAWRIPGTGEPGGLPSMGLRRNSRMPPQLEKNHVVPTAWQDEALARDGVSREVPCSALKGETPWDSPGKNTGVGCQFLLQYMKVKSESDVAQSCPTLG